MLRITFVSGNIFHDHTHADTEYEHLRISRHDAEKSRLRKSTDKGTDIGIVLEQGTRLRHGDILQGDEKTIIIEQIPEKVATLKLDKNDTESLILAGHIIGN
ncbi:MAG: Urease accessory protein, partial [Thaumarchaeota archaeon]|nr:Urease accessory protein [Nitrososphaerota archaeon]